MNALKKEDFLRRFQLRSTFLLNLHVYLAKFLGILPLGLLKDKYCIGRLYSILLLGLLAILSVFSGIIIQIQDSTHSKLEHILNGIWSIILIVFFTMLLVKNITKINYWINMEKSFSKFDDCLCTDLNKNNDRKTQKLSIFILTYFGAVLVFVLDEIFWYNFSDDQDTVDNNAYYMIQFGLFYQFVITMIVKEISQLLKSRYDFIRKYTRFIFKIVFNGEAVSRNEFDIGIGRIKAMYKILFDIVQYLSDFFGTVILVILVLIETVFLVDFSTSLDAGTERLDHFLESCVYVVLYLVSGEKLFYKKKHLGSGFNRENLYNVLLIFFKRLPCKR